MASKLLISLLSIYQRGFSLLLGTNCRFYPSCSQYAKEAIETHGPIKGIYLGTRRVCRCHPWHEGGFDPVPEAHKQTVEKAA